MLPDLESHKSWGERTLEAATERLRWLPAKAAGDPNAPIANGLFIFYLALLVAVLVFVVGALAEWHDGAGQGSIYVDVLWRVTWITFTVLKTLLIVLLVIWGYRRVSGRREERSG